MVKYIEHADIDLLKWDQCINNSNIGLPYALSWYLNILAEGWDGLVQNEYEAVMPLPYKKKYGVMYIYTPFFIQQLGIFCSQSPTEKVQREFLNAIPKKFLSIDLAFNFSNTFLANTLNVKQRNNFVLDLNKSYEEISKRYAQNLIRNLKKAETLTVYSKVNEKEVVEFYINNLKEKTNERISTQVQENILELVKYAVLSGFAFTLQIQNKNEDVLSAAVFLKTSNRIIYLMGISNDLGKLSGANHLILDHVIKQFCGQKIVLDFEGSDIPGVKRFYESFGASNQNYYLLRMKRFPLNLLNNIKN